MWSRSQDSDRRKATSATSAQVMVRGCHGWRRVALRTAGSGCVRSEGRSFDIIARSALDIAIAPHRRYMYRDEQAHQR